MIGKTLIAAALCALPAFAFAQDWKTEWARLVAAAEKEGQVFFQSQPNQGARDFLQREWAKAFPKIELQLSVTPTAQFLARIRTERQADKYLWDVGLAGFTIAYPISREGMLDPVLDELVDPEIKNPALWGGWDTAFVDLQKKYVLATSKFIAGPWYDALKIAPEKVERLKIRTLLDPEYAGKIVWHDPSVPGSGTAVALMLRVLLGDEGLKRLVVDQRVTMVAQQNQVIEAMARGTAWLALGPPVRPLMAPFAQAGVKTDVRPFGNGPDANMESIGGSTLFVFNKRPHPNASKVFVNWLLSKDIQHGFAKAIQQSSRRADVPSVAEPDQTPIPGAKYVHTQWEEDVKKMEDAVRLVGEWQKQVK